MANWSERSDKPARQVADTLMEVAREAGGEIEHRGDLLDSAAAKVKALAQALKRDAGEDTIESVIEDLEDLQKKLESY